MATRSRTDCAAGQTFLTGYSRSVQPSCRVATSSCRVATSGSASCQCWPFALIVARLNAKLTRSERWFFKFSCSFFFFDFSFFIFQIESFCFASFHFIAIRVDFRNVSCGRWIVSCFLVVPAAAAPAEIICNFSFWNASGVVAKWAAIEGATETEVALLS